MAFDKIPSDDVINATAEALRKNGFEVIIAANGSDAKAGVLSMIPKGSQVMTMTSATLEQTGIAKEINDAGGYDSVRAKYAKMDPKTQGQEMRSLGATAEWALGSVHAVTQDGHALVASGSGSQLPAYAYGAARVVWVVGGQKIVKDDKSGAKRIYDYVLPLESERVRKVYGIPGSSVNKLLQFNKERPGRITIVLVKEKLGF